MGPYNRLVFCPPANLQCWPNLLVFYIHFINAGAAVATFAALIGLFCLIMIIGFYDSLIMR